MGIKVAIWLIWCLFVFYTILMAPLEQPGTLTLIEKLVKLQWGDINAYIPTLFSLMGVWPMVYACLMFIDDRRQSIPAWPAFLASNGSGAIGMIPYLLLRQPDQEPPQQQDVWVKLFDSRWMGAGLMVTTIGLLVYALLLGDWQEFVEQWQTSRFLYLMSLDFCMLYLVFPYLLGDDMARRGMREGWVFWLVALVPLLGPLTYLCLRRPLPEVDVVMG